MPLVVRHEVFQCHPIGYQKNVFSDVTHFIPESICASHHNIACFQKPPMVNFHFFAVEGKKLQLIDKLINRMSFFKKRKDRSGGSPPYPYPDRLMLEGGKAGHALTEVETGENLFETDNAIILWFRRAEKNQYTASSQLNDEPCPAASASPPAAACPPGAQSKPDKSI